MFVAIEYAVLRRFTADIIDGTRLRPQSISAGNLFHDRVGGHPDFKPGGRRRGVFPVAGHLQPKNMEVSMSPSAGFVPINQIVPIIEATVPRVVQMIGSENHQELVQDTIASAAKMVESCEVRGKKIIPNSIAYYAIQQSKHGRRSYAATRADALCPAAQLDTTVTLEYLDDDGVDVEDPEGSTLHDVLASREEDPSQKAAREIDWAELLEDFNERDIAVLQCTVNGGRLDKLAAQFGVSSARLCQLKRELGKQVKLRWGEDALENAMRIPAWNGSVNATRERSACQHERALEARR